MEECHPNALLMPVHSLKGNRQDFMMQCASASCINRTYHVEKLDRRLRTHIKSNILEENSWIILTTLVIVAFLHAFIIAHYSIVAPPFDGLLKIHTHHGKKIGL